ncbi:hypothetical protein Acid7E03_29270 [Acidisoma sp. 7E03]
MHRRAVASPSLSLASKRTAPQWHWPRQVFVSSDMLMTLLRNDFTVDRTRAPVRRQSAAAAAQPVIALSFAEKTLRSLGFRKAPA